MKERKPPKGRNLAALALHCKIFAPKTVPAKRGKGTAYSRKGRNESRSDPYLFWWCGSAEIIFGI